MNAELAELGKQARLDAPEHWRLRMAFGLACAQRVRHLLESEEVIAALDDAQAWFAANGGAQTLAPLASKASQLATSHAGSHSIDGTAHAAVSASHAVAAAINGRALDAAAYAAYATVYGYSVTAITDPKAYREEHAQQVRLLRELLAT